MFHAQFSRLEFAPDTDEEMRALAAQALGGAAYHAAFAVGPYQRKGMWQRAHEPEGARQMALALCGTDCRIIAEVVPETREPSETRDFLPAHIAGRIGTVIYKGKSFALARGGVNASGTALEGHTGFPAAKGRLTIARPNAPPNRACSRKTARSVRFTASPRLPICALPFPLARPPM